jgi:hypothetical protein
MTTRPSQQAAADSPAQVRLIFEPIPRAALDRIRAAGVDETGRTVTVQVDKAGGSPLRCCLRESAAGEELLLLAYTPPGTRGAYAERGPVFIHAQPCSGYLTAGQYPPGLHHRQQVVRAYNYEGQIADGVLARDGEHALSVIRDLLGRPDVALVHLRNVGYGCYNFAVRRSMQLAL